MADFNVLTVAGTVLVSAATALGVSGVNAAWAKSLFDRRENERTWHRDHIIERYTEARHALLDLTAAHVEHVEPLLRQRAPSVEALEAGWRELDRAFGVVLVKVTAALVVARPRAWSVLLSCLKVDVAALAPQTRPDGIPPIAIARMNLERNFLADLSTMLLYAIRADLGLWDNEQLAFADARLLRFDSEAKTLRSMFSQAISPVFVYSNIRYYGVQPFVLMDASTPPGTFIFGSEDYTLASEYLDFFIRESLPDLAGTNVQAMLVRGEDGNVMACARREMPVWVIEYRMRQMGMAVESSFHSAPGAREWRVLSDGSTIWIWTQGTN